jgi:hypothetical protein
MAGMKPAKGGVLLFATSGRKRLPCPSHMGNCNRREALARDMQAVAGQLFRSHIAEVDDARRDRKGIQLLIVRRGRDGAFEGGE